MAEINVFICNFNNPEHTKAIPRLMNAYIADKMGGSTPHNEKEQQLLLKGLSEHPTAITFLATVNGEYAGMSNCFVNFGTFAVKQFINIHDVIVLDEYRGLGVGKKIMDAIVDEARKMDCAKITLEVRSDNPVAQGLYKRYGFDECRPPMHFWEKKL
ncbi:MAG: GNAT family N-acetyltransferase [Bacteroidota bacterium]